MGEHNTADKAKHKFEEFKGKAKEGVGNLTGNERLKGEGQADQAEGKTKQVADKAKDAGKDVKDRVKGWTDRDKS